MPIGRPSQRNAPRPSSRTLVDTSIRDRQAGVMIANAISAFASQHSPLLLRKVPSLRRNSSSSGLAAARIVLAGGLEGEARGIENTGQPGTRLANGAEFLRRAVRDAALEYQRLLEASEFELVRNGRVGTSGGSAVAALATL